MKKEIKRPTIINSISEQHRLYALPKPEHPLVSLINFRDIPTGSSGFSGSFTFNFYSIAIKRGFNGKLKYGQNYYDFDEGVMAFMAPGQVLTTEISDDVPRSGWILFFHPEFLRGYPPGKKIKEYGFFSYATNEALHLSEKEEKMVETIMKNIEQEYRSSIDKFSRDVMISHIELLLNYSNRFYNRLFITRKNANSDLLTKPEALLDDYFDSEKVQEFGLPTVKYISEQLNISPNYLSDMLRTLTGQSNRKSQGNFNDYCFFGWRNSL
jgi:AraC family transcriptional regulator, transcriptional activator of pobA